MTDEEIDDRREKYPPEQKVVRKQVQDKKKNHGKPGSHTGGETMSDSNLTAAERKEIIFNREGVIQDASVVDGV